MADKPITLITGTRKGIGRALVNHYVGLGHQVIGCSRGDLDWSLEGYHHLKCDVTKESEVQSLFSFVSQEFKRLDNLINNAGIGHMNHFMLTPTAMAQEVISTNVIGTFLFCREAARLMQRKRKGRIVNFTTVAVPLKLAGEAIYAASKAAVATMTHVLAKELAPFGITVNAIGPTPIETDLIKNVPKDKLQSLLQQQAIPRFGNFEDVSNVTDFLISEKSGFVTGQTIYLGGV